MAVQQQAQAQVCDLPLRVATMQALRMGGTRLFEEPSKFLGILLDYADHDAPTMRVMEYHCDKELLDIFAVASRTRTPEAVEEAANKATLLLRDGRIVQASAAEQTACEISFALANYLSVEPSKRVVAVATGNRGQTAERQKDQTAKTSTDTDSAWYEAMRNRNSVTNLHDESTQEASDTSSDSANDNASKTSSPDTGIDPSKLSADRIKRITQIEDAGIGMTWFVCLEAWCWLCAGASAVKAFSIIHLLGNGPSVDALPHSEQPLFYIMVALVFLYAVTACLCMVSRSRLSKFKAKGPKTFLVALVVALLPGLISLMASPYANEVGGTIQLGHLYLVVTFFINLIFFSINYAYLKKREQFFNL